MSLLAFVLIVSSAALHASWNLIAKKNHMTMVFYAVICVTSACLWLHTQFWTPIHVLDLPARFWLYITASILSDIFYCTGLMMTYRYYEMSTAYPIMRSLPILLTVLVTHLVGLGKPLSPFAIIGMVIVFVGCLMMPLKKFSDFNASVYLKRSMVFVFMCACGTTGYTIFDSEAQHVLAAFASDIATPIRSMTFYSTRGILLSSALWIIVFLTPTNRAIAKDFFRHIHWSNILAGLFASGTYILVLIAMNYVTNVSYVQVFRQLGLPLGMVAGIFFLKEKCAPPKILGVALILTGLALSVVK